MLSIHTSHGPSSDQVQYLELVFYLLLVDKENYFPSLTSSSCDQNASCHTHPAPTPTPWGAGEAGEESDLHMKVREHRLKMGFGLAGSSELVLDRQLVENQLHVVRTQLEATIQSALHHMRKDELWKRLLYGASTSSEGKSVSNLLNALYDAISEHDRSFSFL